MTAQNPLPLYAAPIQAANGIIAYGPPREIVSVIHALDDNTSRTGIHTRAQRADFVMSMDLSAISAFFFKLEFTFTRSSKKKSKRVFSCKKVTQVDNIMT
ncbi:MAG: hypothetical protein DRH26_14695 [Deltaproteobacteria bacterium]|nr:MAG: hypothetical protein DRH26_14695 [Deltaproteobacteria bacterium]